MEIIDIDSKLEIEKIKKELEIANKAKSEFLASISHEIKTPLNGIMGMIDLTMLTKLSEEQEDNLITMKICANSLLNTINDILDYSKLEAGKFIIQYSEFDIFKLIDEVINENIINANEKQLKLYSMIDQNTPQFLIGDFDRIKQVLNNFIHNSIKFTNKGEIIIYIKTIYKDKENIELEFSIKDTGIGISENDRTKLFNSFSQIDRSYTKKYAGTGLGLVINKQLVEIMNGKIKLKSKEKKGSTFYFSLKLGISKKYFNNLKHSNNTTIIDNKVSVSYNEDSMNLNSEFSKDIYNNIELLKKELKSKNFIFVNNILNDLKDLFVNIGKEDLKDLSFKIQLACRRDNLKQAEEYIEKLEIKLKEEVI